MKYTIIEAVEVKNITYHANLTRVRIV